SEPQGLEPEAVLSDRRLRFAQDPAGARRRNGRLLRPDEEPRAVRDRTAAGRPLALERGAPLDDREEPRVSDEEGSANGELSLRRVMRSLVTYIATSIVDEPGAVRVREVSGPRETRIELRVAPREVGKLIGRQGRTVHALRTLLAVAGRKSEKRFRLE